MASSPKIDDLRKKFEDNPRRYFAPLANEYRKAGEVEQAIAICREYLPQQPGHMSGHIVFGQALYDARQLDEASAVFETALSLDPENLIALRHLGDIALMAGQTEAAKTWYKRVLEADPRNEETQAQLASLESKGVPAAAPAPVAPVESLSTAQTTPFRVPNLPAASSAPTVEIKKMGPPPRPARPPMAPAGAAVPAVPPATAPAVAATADSVTTEIRLDGLTSGEPSATVSSTGPVDMPTTLVMEIPHAATPVASHDAPVVTQTIGLETTSMTGAGAPPTDSSSLDRLEITSFSALPPPTAVAARPVLDPDLQAPPPGAPAAIAEFTVPAPSASALPARALNVPSVAVAAPAPETAWGFAEPPVATDAAAQLPSAMGIAIPATAPKSGPFVTETMAELYLQQGLSDEAQRVYRALLDQKPGDTALRAKVASLEAAAMPDSAPTAPVPLESIGPSIREVLVRIAQRRPGYPPEANGNSMTQPEPSPMETSYAEPAPVAATRWATDALGALWRHAEPDAGEESAALMLATSFADLNGMENGGAPALDLTVAAAAGWATPMVAVPGPTAPRASFSFDRFFSQRVTAEHASVASGPIAQPESKEDIARFTRWLEGLKQR